MKILVDLTYIHEEYNTGLAHFAFKLLRGFRENGNADEISVLVEDGYQNGFAHLIQGYRTIPVRSRSIKGLPFTRSTMMRKTLDRIIREGGFDIFLSTYMYDRSLTTSLIPSVGVIHDTYQFEKQKNLLLKLRFLIGAVPACNKFTRIATISECSRMDICRIRGIKTPVEVIPVSVISNAEPSSKERQETPYILNVNTITAYKNLITLVRALDILKERIPHKLKVKGRRSEYWDNVILPYLTSHGLEDRVELIDRNLSGDEIDRLYVNADLFVTPSTMEGFGATPIEAALAGVPVICNALPTLMESTLNLATYYTPAFDAQALAVKILSVLENTDSIDTDAIREAYREAYSPALQARRFSSLFASLR